MSSFAPWTKSGGWRRHGPGCWPAIARPARAASIPACPRSPTAWSGSTRRPRSGQGACSRCVDTRSHAGGGAGVDADGGGMSPPPPPPQHYRPLLEAATEREAHESSASRVVEGLSQVKGPPAQGGGRPGTSPALTRSPVKSPLSPAPSLGGSRRGAPALGPGLGFVGRDPAGRARTKSRHAIRRESLSQHVEGATEALARARARARATEDTTRGNASIALRARREPGDSLRRLQPPLPGEVPPRHKPLSPEARQARVAIYRGPSKGGATARRPPARGGEAPAQPAGPRAPAPSQEGQGAGLPDRRELTVPLDDLPSGSRGATLRETVSHTVAPVGPAPQSKQALVSARAGARPPEARQQP